jgi:hypothetical protein
MISKQLDLIIKCQNRGQIHNSLVIEMNYILFLIVLNYIRHTYKKSLVTRKFKKIQNFIEMLFLRSYDITTFYFATK